MADDLSVNYPR